MNCIYCGKSVIGKNPVTVQGAGPAHRTCYEVELISQGVFKGLSVKKLSDEDLAELDQMLKIEMNSRQQINDISLF